MQTTPVSNRFRVRLNQPKLWFALLFGCVCVLPPWQPALAAKKCDLVPTLQKMVPTAVRSPIVLFEGAGPPTSKAYDEMIRKLKVGDVIQYGDGSQNTIHRILGEGDTSFVFEAENGEVIRIPATADERSRNLFHSFPAENEMLKSAGVPVIEMISEKNIPFQRIVLKKEPFQFTLADYLAGAAGKTMDKAQKKVIEDKLVEFARKTWRFQRIFDFRPEQMAYTEKGEWVLFDMGDTSSEMPEVLLSDLKDKGNCFSPVPYENYVTKGQKDKFGYAEIVPKKLYERIDEAVQAERKFQRKNYEFVKRDHANRDGLIQVMTVDPVPEGTVLTRASVCRQQNYYEVDGPCTIIPEVKITVLKHLNDEKSLGTYSVKLSSGKSAVLKLMRDQAPDTFKLFKKTIQKSTEQGSLLESGSDFVLLKP